MQFHTIKVFRPNRLCDVFQYESKGFCPPFKVRTYVTYPMHNQYEHPLHLPLRFSSQLDLSETTRTEEIVVDIAPHGTAVYRFLNDTNQPHRVWFFELDTLKWKKASKTLQFLDMYYKLMITSVRVGPRETLLGEFPALDLFKNPLYTEKLRVYMPVIERHMILAMTFQNNSDAHVRLIGRMKLEIPKD